MTFATQPGPLARFADYPLARVRLQPKPGTGTEQDVLDIEQREGKLCELIDGVLVEKTVGLKESTIAAKLIHRLLSHVEPAGLGEVTGADGAMKLIPGLIRIPDVAFISKAKLPKGQLPDEPIPELVPDLAVEVLSISNSRGEMFDKRKDYFFCGVRLVWVLDRWNRTVEVYTAPDEVTRLIATDTLTGGTVLPGFVVPVAQLFPPG